MQPEQPATTPEAEPASAPTADALPRAEPVQQPHKRVVYRRPPKNPRMGLLVRAVLLAMAACLLAVFVTAFRLDPYDGNGQPRKMATHTQLGLPQCNFVVMTGKPCPSCGMTTSFALLVRGDVLASLRANWVGSTICVLWAVMLVWAMASSIWGKVLLIPPGRTELTLTVIVGVVLVLMLARWAAILFL